MYTFSESQHQANLSEDDAQDDDSNNNKNEENEENANNKIMQCYTSLKSETQVDLEFD